MSLAAHLTPPISHRPGRSWLSRLVRSSAFAWSVSIGLHLGAFAAVYPLVLNQDAQPRRMIIPEARLAPGGEVGNEPSRLPPAKLELQIKPVERPPALPDPDESVIRLDQLPPSMSAAATLPLVAPAPVDADSGLAAAVAGGPAASNLGPTSTFFGQAGNAYRVVYVVDISGSLVTFAEQVMAEMRRSIEGLVPTQQFNIVLTYGAKVDEFRPKALVWANGQQKGAAAEFLKKLVPTGSARPIEAMERAFAAKPELIYFLSDGDYEDVKEAVDTGRKTILERHLAELNRARGVRITVIGFDPSPQPRAILERVARDHGGNYRTVVPK